MKALTEGQYRGRDGIWAVFDLGWDTELRVGILEHDIGRVVMKRAGGYALDRGWSIAPNGLEPPFEGRSRDSIEGFTCPEASVVATGRHGRAGSRRLDRRGQLVALRHCLAPHRGKPTLSQGPADAGLFHVAKVRRAAARRRAA